jgi:ribose 5-phosphate isomerase B
MKILVGSDGLGFLLKEAVKAHLDSLGHEVIDVGVNSVRDSTDYPDIALDLSRRIVTGVSDRGILICGTGIGMAIAANKVPGVRAACAHDPYSAERARKSNDAQVLTLGAQIIGPEVAVSLVDHWLASEFLGGRSARKVAKLKAMEVRGPN